MQNFNEWMSIRQMNEPLTTPGSYQFSGTYDLEALPELVNNSESLTIDEAMKLVPAQYQQQFTGDDNYQAGKVYTEEDKECVWVSNSAGTVYLFEKV